MAFTLSYTGISIFVHIMYEIIIILSSLVYYCVYNCYDGIISSAFIFYNVYNIIIYYNDDFESDMVDAFKTCQGQSTNIFFNNIVCWWIISHR